MFPVLHCFSRNKNNKLEEIYEMYLNPLDISRASLRHRSKCLYVSIVLCIMFSLIAAASLIIKMKKPPPGKPIRKQL
jgi:hypothetical protein